MRKISLGLIETWGYVPAIEAADAGTKAADVILLGYEITPSALVTVKFVGDVSAVKASVSAGMTAAAKVGKVIAAHVIPRPDLQLGIRLSDQSPGNTADSATAPKTPPAGRKTVAASKPKRARPKSSVAAPVKGRSSLFKKSNRPDSSTMKKGPGKET
jgi:microcompartment protein CcmL/EutN